MNVVMVQGAVVHLTEPKQFHSGVPFSTMGITANDRDENRIDVQLWGGVSEWCQQNVKEGSEVLVVGEAKRAEWVDKRTGEDRYRLVINAKQVVPSALVPDGVRGGRIFGGYDEDEC